MMSTRGSSLPSCEAFYSCGLPSRLNKCSWPRCLPRAMWVQTIVAYSNSSVGQDVPGKYKMIVSRRKYTEHVPSSKQIGSEQMTVAGIQLISFTSGSECSSLSTRYFDNLVFSRCVSLFSSYSISTLLKTFEATDWCMLPLWALLCWLWDAAGCLCCDSFGEVVSAALDVRFMAEILQCKAIKKK